MDHFKGIKIIPSVGMNPTGLDLGVARGAWAGSCRIWGWQLHPKAGTAQHRQHSLPRKSGIALPE